ncbi:MAG: PDZ domain-containing protein [Pseudomonadota bacterium]
MLRTRLLTLAIAFAISGGGVAFVRGETAHANDRVAALTSALGAQSDALRRVEQALAREVEARRQLAATLATLRERPPSPTPAKLANPAAYETASSPGNAALARDEAAHVRQSLTRIAADRDLQTWQRRRDAFLASPEGFRLDVLNPLRAELGDDTYARYLSTLGRSTAVAVGALPEGSEVAAAGLRGGDQLTHYDGQRVFHLHELHALSVQGERGEYVHVQLLRDGETVYLVIPRGPLGTSPVHTLG